MANLLGRLFIKASVVETKRRSLARFLLRGHLGTFFTGFREADGDGLLATRHFLAGLAALQFALFVLVHDIANRFLGLFAIFPRHGSLLFLKDFLNRTVGGVME